MITAAIVEANRASDEAAPTCRRLAPCAGSPRENASRQVVSVRKLSPLGAQRGRPHLAMGRSHPPNANQSHPVIASLATDSGAYVSLQPLATVICEAIFSAVSTDSDPEFRKNTWSDAFGEILRARSRARTGAGMPHLERSVRKVLVPKLGLTASGSRDGMVLRLHTRTGLRHRDLLSVESHNTSRALFKTAAWT